MLQCFGSIFGAKTSNIQIGSHFPQLGSKDSYDGHVFEGLTALKQEELDVKDFVKEEKVEDMSAKGIDSKIVEAEVIEERSWWKRWRICSREVWNKKMISHLSTKNPILG